VSAITDAFGDPTRRSIYLFVKECSGDRTESDLGVTASMVAAEVGVHANVARHHLDKLAAGGYLEVVSTRVAGAGAGRRHR
jgi:predicted ArsR family transcriptional regulator